MEQKTLAKWLKVILIGLGVCGLIVYALIVPMYGKSLAEKYPDLADRFWPWLALIWLTGLPCFAALVFGWKIATGIGRDRSFTIENAMHLKWIAYLAGGDSAMVFIGNALYLVLNLSHPGVMLLSLIIVFGGIAIAVAAGALSHLVRKAATLQEQSDLTI